MKALLGSCLAALTFACSGNSAAQASVANPYAGFSIVSITDHDSVPPDGCAEFTGRPSPYPETKPVNFPADTTWPWPDYARLGGVAVINHPEPRFKEWYREMENGPIRLFLNPFSLVPR